jgi:hypothetical protein
MTKSFAQGALCAGIIVGAGLSWGALTATADIGSLDADGLRKAVTGKTLTIETPMGDLPISFSADGTMSGRSPDMASYLGRATDRGTWWISSNQLCQRWKTWLDAKSYCFTLRKDGTQVRWTRNDGLKGVLVVSN